MRNLVGMSIIATFVYGGFFDNITVEPYSDFLYGIDIPPMDEDVVVTTVAPTSSQNAAVDETLPLMERLSALERFFDQGTTVEPPLLTTPTANPLLELLDGLEILDFNESYTTGTSPTMDGLLDSAFPVDITRQ
ncbi:hypothetical protein FOL47_006015, partial [Perkinsus chesapeaki]